MILPLWRCPSVSVNSSKLLPFSSLFPWQCTFEFVDPPLFFSGETRFMFFFSTSLRAADCLFRVAPSCLLFRTTALSGHERAPFLLTVRDENGFFFGLISPCVLVYRVHFSVALFPLNRAPLQMTAFRFPLFYPAT